METLKISYVKLDLNMNILDFNNNLINLFRLNKKDLKGQSVDNIVNIKEHQKCISKLTNGQQISVMIFKHHKAYNASFENATIILYTLIRRENDEYHIRIINWLNWLHNIYGSIELGYESLSLINDKYEKNDFKSLSNIACFKAFYPLLALTPNKFNPLAFYNILRIFTPKKQEAYSKDYTRNICSRLITNVKREIGISISNPIEVIKNEDLLNFRYKGEICIPNTSTINDLIIPVETDHFLVSVMLAKY